MIEHIEHEVGCKMQNDESVVHSFAPVSTAAIRPYTHTSFVVYEKVCSHYNILLVIHTKPLFLNFAYNHQQLDFTYCLVYLLRPFFLCLGPVQLCSPIISVTAEWICMKLGLSR